MTTSEFAGLRERAQLVSARDVALDILREQIYSGALGSGDRVKVQDLASELRISRTPVREAAWQLAAEGLIEVHARVGFFVREISPTEVLDIYDVRLALEPVIAANAAQRGTDLERKAFYESVTHLESAMRQSNVREYVLVIEHRRRELLKMARNRALEDTLQGLDSRVRLLRMRNLSQDGALNVSQEQHRAVAKAVAMGDPELAYEAMADHVADARDRMRRFVASSLDTRGDGEARSPIDALVTNKKLVKTMPSGDPRTAMEPVKQ